MHQRDRRGPVFRADVQSRGSIRLVHQTMHLLIFLHKLVAVLLVFRIVAGGNDFMSGDRLAPIYLRAANFIKAPPVNPVAH